LVLHPSFGGNIRMRFVLSCFLISALFSCKDKADTLFTLLPSNETNLVFENHVEESQELNIISYEYLYNGGGTAVADFNGDGLQDIFVTGNMVPNKLFLNHGAWKFEDITATASVAGRNGWKTGVTVADVSGDGLQDIYICYSGPGSDEDRTNQLFVNNGGSTPTFTEKAKDFGLAATGTYSTQASFFDFDLDGDLDMFLLNHAKITYSPFYNTTRLRNLRHKRFGNRLYRNDKGFFKDVSAEAGIHGSGINFGLGVSVSDVNLDGWPDIYVTNDYEEQDFFYLNQKDGTFRECLKDGFRHISRFGMGSDVADFNNDGLADVMVVDMLPEDGYRQKLLKGPDEYDKYMLLRDSGYHHQNMRNMLQVNVGNNAAGMPQFSEVGQLAGVAATDWSWCPLFVDLDNDGWKDLFITNGYLRDYTNLDFLKYTFEDSKRLAAQQARAFDTLELVKQMPSTKLQNYCFKNSADLRFENVSDEWGFRETAVSTSAVYADLDNDGDNDILVNNINDRLHVYRNDARQQNGNHYIKIHLQGDSVNTRAIGAKVFVTSGALNQFQENFPTRGFQSCMGGDLLFGLGQSNALSTVTIHWPGGRVSRKAGLRADSTYHFKISDSEDTVLTAETTTPGLFSRAEVPGLSFVHSENEFVDYKHQFLLPFKLSTNGPCMATADLNGDGYDDIFIGGAAGQSGQLFISSDGNYKLSKTQPWSADAEREDTDAAFLDVDNDADMDLLVASGGVEFSNENNDLYRDRIYLNDGNGKFTRKMEPFPGERSNGGCIAHCDFDHDGDQDVFVGGRSLPGYFPLPAYSHLMRNDSKDGTIRFTDVTPSFLKKPGMINSALWLDYNNDGWEDLLLGGDFTPILVFKNTNGAMGKEMDTSVFASAGNGMWSKLSKVDVDADGDLDVFAGNFGLNIQFKASTGKPLTLHYGDFNDDGKIDPILTHVIGERQNVYASRDELLEQLPHLKRKFVKYDQYAAAGLGDLLTADQLARSKTLRADNLQSVVMINNGKNRFEMRPLPIEAQVSRISAVIADDFTGDNVTDLLIAGNFYPLRVQLGRMDASTGLLLKGDGQGRFTALNFKQTLFFASGDVRSMARLRTPAEPLVILGVNDDSIKLFSVNK
jgi:enediyne biosynthesis protein E4